LLGDRHYDRLIKIIGVDGIGVFAEKKLYILIPAFTAENQLKTRKRFRTQKT